ncbi:putative protein [Rosellinia necatrix]|uniref:DUF7580 domain-containing protein n=1 Tax=Rosellinia necatrix TaxID=77044 RepID=A0A1W2TN56_ROSNE|nr:putative protein [Rosellinia necatrix]
MSGFEIAGVVFGAIPLVISALEHYKTGQSTLAALIKYQGQLDKLLYQLKVQQTAFYFDILQLLRSADIEEVENRTDISPDDCLSILQKDKTGIKLQKYLGIHYSTFLDTLRRYEQCLKKISKKLRHVRRLPGASKDDLAALLVANPTVDGRFEFQERISFSIERGALNALVVELGEDRLNLKTIIKGMKTEKEHCARSPSNDSKRLSRVLAQVSASAKALYIAMCQSCACACQNNHRVFLELRNPIPQSRPTRTKAPLQANLIIFNLVFQMETHFREAYVEASPHDVLDSIPIRNTSRHVSFQEYKSRVPSITLFEENQPAEVSTKVLGICDLVSQSQTRDYMLSLKLKGQALDFIQKPHQIQRELSTPTTLEAVLRQGATDKKFQMTPKQRSLLALDIASSVIQLRKTYWSDPAVNSKVVKCILGANGKNARVFTIAFIEKVTEISRADSPGSEPKVALLELAILLLEIWHHETLEMWASAAGFGETGTTRERMAAATEWLEATAEEFPLRYLEAVEQSLSLCVQRSRQWDDYEFLRLYCENVIIPLQISCEAW